MRITSIRRLSTGRIMGFASGWKGIFWAKWVTKTSYRCEPYNKSHERSKLGRKEVSFRDVRPSCFCPSGTFVACSLFTLLFLCHWKIKMDGLLGVHAVYFKGEIRFDDRILWELTLSNNEKRARQRGPAPNKRFRWHFIAPNMHKWIFADKKKKKNYI